MLRSFVSAARWVIIKCICLFELQAVPETEDREGCPRDGWHRRKAQADVFEMGKLRRVGPPS